MRRILLASALFTLMGSAYANDDIHITGLSQTEFDGVSQDLGAITSYKQLEGSSSEGILGFDVGLNAGVTKVAHSTDWEAATHDNSVTSLPFADVTVTKGLPLGFDIGGEYSVVPGSNVHLYGLEARYAILDGGIAEPAVGLRAAFTHVTGVDDLSFNTKSLGISISKGFGPITPFGGVAEVWTSSDPNVAGLSSVSFTDPEVFAGVTFDLGVHLALEYDHLSGNTTWTAKLGFGF